MTRSLGQDRTAEPQAPEPGGLANGIGAVSLAALALMGTILGGCKAAQPLDLPAAVAPVSPLEPAVPPAPLPVRPTKPPKDKPLIRTMPAGWSTQGQSLTAHLFGGDTGCTLVIGGIHGDEPTGANLARRLVQFLRENPSAWRGRSVAVLIAANPDGLNLAQRTNPNGVDLNRNFPARNWQRTSRGKYYGGPAPASEKETRAVIRLAEQLKPARIISLHSISRGRCCNNYDGPARELARQMSGYNGYPPKETIGYPTPGSLGSWAGIDRQIPVVTLELPEELGGEECWRQNRDALLAACRAD